jgi:predicted Fe-Mo cluster-binding NifX family protein
MRVAIPVFRARISPAFDTCTRVLLIDLEQKQEIERREIYLDEFSLSERVTILQNARIETVICGGISDVFHNMLKGAKINSIIGRAGEVEQIVYAFLREQLDEPRFHMPGYKAKKIG